MKKVALYGGSFDPPQLGHVIAITAVLNSQLADEVWLVPVGLNKSKKLRASVDDRKAMISIMLATMFGSRVPVFLNMTQIQRERHISTTIDLLKDMEEAHPKIIFKFIIGSDLVHDIPNWSHAEELMKRKPFLMIPRLGFDIKKKLPEYITCVPTSNLAVTNISSSLVRKLVKEGKSLEGIVPPAVICHILKNKLYIKEKVEGRTKKPIVVTRGRFTRYMNRNGWEYIERINGVEAVFILALTADEKVILIEQFRPPLNKTVIELPAGLIGDSDCSSESVSKAAIRELLEETGYKAKRITPLTTSGPLSSGLSSELGTLVMAWDVNKISCRNGVGDENIKVHEIPCSGIERWLNKMFRKGIMLDPKIYAALYFLEKEIINYRKRHNGKHF